VCSVCRCVYVCVYVCVIVCGVYVCMCVCVYVYGACMCVYYVCDVCVVYVMCVLCVCYCVLLCVVCCVYWHHSAAQHITSQIQLGVLPILLLPAQVGVKTIYLIWFPKQENHQKNHNRVFMVVIPPYKFLFGYIVPIHLLSNSPRGTGSSTGMDCTGLCWSS
jgi:hypothetical protein